VLAIRFYRLKRGWSQDTLGALAGVGKERICNIELGNHTPNDALLAKLALALDVAPAFTLLRPVVIHNTIDAVFTDTGEQVRA
jgi:transcriptional regulator with XRE-family HTH domain